MLIVLAIFSAGLLGAILYFAFSPKSSRLLRLAALIALGLIGLTIGICAIFLIMDPEEKTEDIPMPVFSDTPQEKSRPENIIEVIMFLVIFLAIMAVVAFLAIREHHKKAEIPDKKPEAKPVFGNTSELDDLELKHPETDAKNDDNDFDIGLDFKNDP